VLHALEDIDVLFNLEAFNHVGYGTEESATSGVITVRGKTNNEGNGGHVYNRAKPTGFVKKVRQIVIQRV